MNKERKALTKIDIFPIEKFNYTKFSEDHSVSFIGSPIKHPYEDNKFILICDPLNPDTDFLEFQKENVLFLEELPALISEKGETIYMAKIFIKKGTVGIKYKPFVVGEE